MALPVAPLGQLSNINLPNYIPANPEKQDPLKLALAAFLQGALQQTGGRLAQNATSRDFADKPAGFIEKLTQGPRMSAEMQQQKVNNDAVNSRLDKELGGMNTRLGQTIASQEKLAGNEVNSRESMAKLDRDLKKLLADNENQQRSREFKATMGQRKDEFNQRVGMDQAQFTLLADKHGVDKATVEARLAGILEDNKQAPDRAALVKAQTNAENAKTAALNESTRGEKGVNDLRDKARQPKPGPLDNAKMPPVPKSNKEPSAEPDNRKITEGKFAAPTTKESRDGKTWYDNETSDPTVRRILGLPDKSKETDNTAPEGRPMPPQAREAQTKNAPQSSPSYMDRLRKDFGEFGDALTGGKESLEEAMKRNPDLVRWQQENLPAEKFKSLYR